MFSETNPRLRCYHKNCSFQRGSEVGQKTCRQSGSVQTVTAWNTASRGL
ncbi:hypothetical protein PVAP13_1KG520000 [Panicum virgatum]|uniref:Uncharacterized protein n=1 Tax=Panicum virgatum TaxID=38727 RepID=A0A8T0Y4G1_PANVG|nr:hypothetical protein PVAP13_1KG520000 [Panicum virgatum]